ncbi:MAG TPA: TlpA disulfide reductase family protein, partial [Planctomycetaceae bacterium]|nr:TlpA disulfide reductase family protein [Planctomycetaceae bacterium]
MLRLWIGLLLLVAGCSRTPTLSPSGSPDSGFTEAAEKAVPNPSGEEAPPALTVGSEAPPLKVSRFLKGEPVTSFEPGKVYVVEFWATWCGPCVAAMPHVTALQKQYPDVTFIGVNVLEDDDAPAENFLREKGDAIGYRIARDDIAPGASAEDGAMSQTWLKASESPGIPAAFVVDGQGHIASISHPMELDESLPQIIAGTWDYAAAAKKHVESLVESRHESRFRERFGTLAEAGASN